MRRADTSIYTRARSHTHLTQHWCNIGSCFEQRPHKRHGLQCFAESHLVCQNTTGTLETAHAHHAIKHELSFSVLEKPKTTRATTTTRDTHLDTISLMGTQFTAEMRIHHNGHH